MRRETGVQFQLRPRQRLREVGTAAFVLPRQTGFDLNGSTTQQHRTVGKARSIRRIADRGRRLLLRTHREHEHQAQRDSCELTAHDTGA